MNWRQGKLEDLVFFQRGYDITKAAQKPGPYPVISSSGTTSYHNEFMVNGPGVIIGRKGSLGTVYYSSEDYWPHDTTLWSKDFRGNDPQFVYYFVHTLGLSNFDVGGANPTLNRNHIHKLDILIPPLPDQQKIAAILIAYDDLIAANQRRIQLLEESARLLYREWFVKLRFPGHVTAPFKDGVPEGWRYEKLEAAFVLQRGFDLPASERLDGDIPVYASTGLAGFHNHAKVPGPGVVTGRSGTLGEVHFVHEDFWPLNTTLWVKEFKKIRPLLAYFILGSLYLSVYNAGASVPTLDRKTVHAIDILIPNESVQDQFEKAVMPMFDQIRDIVQYNNRLKEARDLLLPKLMSGALDVSRITVPQEVAA